jgi:citrate synthase
MSLYTLARAVEAAAIRLLEEYKPGRRLQTNVEFYTALLLHGLGLDAALFTPTFAVSRVSGWIAHAFEQRGANRIIRPQSEYVGPRDWKWVPLSDRIDTLRTCVGGSNELAARRVQKDPPYGCIPPSGA